MSLSRTILAGFLAVSSLGIATAGHAQAEIICLDGAVERGDCVPVLMAPDEANGTVDGKEIVIGANQAADGGDQPNDE